MDDWLRPDTIERAAKVAAQGKDPILGAIVAVSVDPVSDVTVLHCERYAARVSNLRLSACRWSPKTFLVILAGAVNTEAAKHAIAEGFVR